MPIDLSKISTEKVHQAFCELKEFCYLSSDNDFITVTEWSNGEGFDVEISRKNSIDKFSLTHGELEAINFLKKLV